MLISVNITDRQTYQKHSSEPHNNYLKFLGFFRHCYWVYSFSVILRQGF